MRRLTDVTDALEAAAGESVGQADVARALGQFDAVWDALSPREQGRVLGLLVERVEHDGREASVAITFRPTGIKTLAAEEEAA